MSTATLPEQTTRSAPYSIGDRVAACYFDNGTTLARGTVIAVNERNHDAGWIVRVAIDNGREEVYTLPHGDRHDFIGRARDYPRLFATERTTTIGRAAAGVLANPEANPTSLDTIARTLAEVLSGNYFHPGEAGQALTAFLTAYEDSKTRNAEILAAREVTA